jgi:hypothetical protein
VAVGSGCGVLVGGAGVLVGGSGVLVGGAGVLVGGSGVLVGGAGVLVGGSSVLVGKGVLVGIGVAVGKGVEVRVAVAVGGCGVSVCVAVGGAAVAVLAGMAVLVAADVLVGVTSSSLVSSAIASSMGSGAPAEQAARKKNKPISRTAERVPNIVSSLRANCRLLLIYIAFRGLILTSYNNLDDKLTAPRGSESALTIYSWSFANSAHWKLEQIFCIIAGVSFRVFCCL